MVLGIGLILLSLGFLIYGIVKKNRKMIIGGIIGLVLIALLYAIYSYLYSLTPY